MKKQNSVGIAALAALGLAFSVPANASSLGKIGKAISYPVKKAAHNGGKNAAQGANAVTYSVKKGASNGSKSVNHVGKTVEYPVRKAGVNTSKTAHKATGQ